MLAGIGSILQDEGSQKMDGGMDETEKHAAFTVHTPAHSLVQTEVLQWQR